MVKGVLSRGKVSLLTAMVALLPAGLWQNGILAQTPMNARNEIHLVKSRVFNIPVHIEKSKTKEVTLYMRDGPPPAPWVKVETVFPTAEWFKCQVPHDGEFSFLVVTTDLYNRPSVTDINRAAPAMTILVDTTIQLPRSEQVSAPAPFPANPDAPPQQILGTPPSGRAYEMPNGAPNYSTFPPPTHDLPTGTSTSGGPSVLPGGKPSAAVPGNLPTILPSNPSTVSNYSPRMTSGTAQLLNTNHVAIDYNVGRAGSSGVGKIDVWMTKDNGSSWQRVSEETNNRKPITAEFPGDGVFGIRLVATNGNGFGGKPPAPGDAPSTTFEVDMTPPQIHSFAPDTMPKNGALSLRWKVTDKNLGMEPINLFYSSQSNGPWIPIALKVKNDEVYHWTLPRDLPPQLYFRLEATDLVQNQKRFDTQTPIMLDMTEPQIDVISVQPVTMPGRGN